MREKIVKLNEVTLYTQSFGQHVDPAVLLIMGATASMLWWDENFCRQLADRGFFVIRYDNRDTGKSTTYPPGETPYKLDDMADDAIGILDAYQIQQAHFVGMSLGGTLVQIAALKYPQRVQSLTLLATGPFGPTDPTIPAMDQRIVDFQAKAPRVDWSDEEAVVNYVVESWELLSGPERHYDQSRGKELAREEFKRANNYVSMFNHAGLEGDSDYYGKVAQISQPTLIIHGTADKIWHYKHALNLVEQIPQATLVTLEGAGHELAPQDWPVVIDAITKQIVAQK